MNVVLRVATHSPVSILWSLSLFEPGISNGIMISVPSSSLYTAYLESFTLELCYMLESHEQSTQPYVRALQAQSPTARERIEESGSRKTLTRAITGNVGSAMSKQLQGVD